MPIYEALRNLEVVDADGKRSEIRAGEWLRTPGPDEEIIEQACDDFVVVYEPEEERSDWWL